MILPSQALRALIIGSQPMIVAPNGFDIGKQVQPASFDCRLGDVVYCVESSCLPNESETVEDLLARHTRYSFELNKECVLERGVCYVVPLQEGLSLSKDFYATFSPKSSTGRCDVFVRVMTNQCTRYDWTIRGYNGPLYLEIIPLSFSVRVIAGLSLVQMRIQTGDEILSDYELALLHAEYGIVFSNQGELFDNSKVKILRNSLCFHVDLSREIVGFEARSSAIKDIHLHKVDYHDISSFWIPLRRPDNGELILTEGNFYLLTTQERVKIPPICCAEIAAYDVKSGEFRAHYAGFFDNGFGTEVGTVAVLEVRVRDTPRFCISDGQIICSMVFSKTTEIPDVLYGKETNASYISSGPSLSKHFKNRQNAWT